MKKLKNSGFGDDYTQRQMTAVARWEKVQADGKWLWLFKRGAIWLTLLLFIYGLGAWLVPSEFNFQITQFYMLVGMFGAFMVNSIIEWSKMEKAYQKQNNTR
jgi:hypothetical protein